MPDTAGTTVTADEMDRAISQLNRSLRRLRLDRADRKAIAEDVREDLIAAAAEGVRPVDMLGPDIDAFARQTVDAGGYDPRTDDYPRVLVIGTLAAALGLPAAYLLLSYLLHPLFVTWFDLDGHYPTAGPVLAYALLVLMGTSVVVTALYAGLAGRPARTETAARAALLTPIAGGLGIVAVLAVMDRPGFTLSEVSIYTQILPAGALPVLVALAIARWWARRTATGSKAPTELP